MIPALWIAIALGHSSPDRAILDAVDRACAGDDACTVDAVLWAHDESSLRQHPVPVSWDAKGGKAHGVWQFWGPVGEDTLDAQASEWARRRSASLAHYGDLRELAGVNDAGARIAHLRARQAEGLRTEIETWRSLWTLAR